MATMQPDEGTTRSRVRELIKLSTDDPLAPFALRPEKSHVFSADGRAAVGYRMRCGLAVVGGDPIGDPLSWEGAITAFVAAVEPSSRGLAVLGAGERARLMWEGYGLTAVPIGRDVVIRPADYTLVGRRFRNLRQAIQRARNAGVTVDVWREGDVPTMVQREVRRALELAGRAKEQRGFAMTLGLPFDGRQPEALLLLGRDRGGRVVGMQRYLVAGPKDLSLDVPIRVPGAPNGVDERLAHEAISWASGNGVARVSLAFAPFPDLFGEQQLGPLGRIGRRLVHVLDPLIKVERLYRYLRKFHAFDQQRHVMLRLRQLPRAATALLLLEFRG